ncbi:MAG: hypothetical protein EI684_08895 [Candidatus Viridilinea halotolerans]|uniref:Uncharacterized protein n=1 Tax=Candidatus Viridilinea halotolerans TaxID=2491704 RepID=A0A426U1L0_9CHLR|nr:MAG: hypothetical protein EI684_08895 [Candidatus Viridilinea halotolerans]
MTEPTGEVRVRSVRTPQSSNAWEQVADVAGGVLRIGFAVTTLPLALLPAASQQHIRNAAQDIMRAVVTLPGEFSNIVSESVEKWAAEQGVDGPDGGKAPKDEMSDK